MRHRSDHRKLGRTASHRKAMLANMVTSLFRSERITTTDAKAKEARRLAERLITRAKKGHTAHKGGDGAVALAHWRQAARVVRQTDVLRKLFDEIAPLYLERNGGYTRIIKLEPRLGDNARLVILELIGTKITSLPKMKGGAAAAAEEASAAEAKPKKKAKAKEKAPAKEKSAKTSRRKQSKAKAKTNAKTRTKAKSKARTGA